MTMVKEAGCDVHAIEKVIQTYVPDVALESNVSAI